MKLYRLKTIAAFHDLRNLPKPEHPLISLVDVTTMTKKPEETPVGLILDFYSIALKRNLPTLISFPASFACVSVRPTLAASGWE